MSNLTGAITMQPPVKRTAQSNSVAVAGSDPNFQQRLIAELDSVNQPSATRHNTAINSPSSRKEPATGTPPAADTVPAASNTQGTATGLVERVTNGVAVHDQTPLYERLYGRPSASHSAALHSAATESLTPKSADSVSTSRIRDFANAIRSPASIAAIELGTTTNTIIAFAGLETGWGRHVPAADGHSSHNLFGIKSNSNGPSVSSLTTEFIDGEPHSIAQQFRSYQSVGESIADFSRFLRTNPRYELALNHAGNPERFIQLVHDAGYATDPDYANKVISALEQLNTITKTTGAIGIGWK